MSASPRLRRAAPRHPGTCEGVRDCGPPDAGQLEAITQINSIINELKPEYDRAISATRSFLTRTRIQEFRLAAYLLR